MNLTSPAFIEGGPIPEQYSKNGANHNPPLNISDVPSGTKSLALIVDDPDAPMGTFTHWLVLNIAPETRFIQEGAVPGAAVQGKNDLGKNDYTGPKPPSGTHRYFFKLFALDMTLELPEGFTRAGLEQRINYHGIGEATLMGIYSSKN